MHFFQTRSIYWQDGDINQDRFAKAYAEWSYMTFAAQKLAGRDPMICPACGPQPPCIHIDGNAKLYRYKSAGGASTLKPYMQDVCIFNNASVDAHVTETEPGNSEVCTTYVLFSLNLRFLKKRTALISSTHTIPFDILLKRS